ncbi:serine/threonine-protein kinase [Kitasatospora sp. NPDC088346]|uniref:serine/threonine-protein kinase n=1 Tax=Kitasatospora sp. NPDC088346 TaxID=3364073 RepID=UPI00380AB65B
MTKEPGRAVGDVVAGRFELRQRLGSGAMGTVWRAHDAVLERDIALKEMRPLRHEDAARADHMRARAVREAKALARLNHPNAVTIYEIVDDLPYPWLVMEFVSGVPLDELLRDRTLSPAQAASVGLDILAALRAAHAAGVLHRDVKPANVLIRPDGSAVLTDFGIAALQGSLDLTATGDLIGSPDYLAPERISAESAEIGPASDLWSLGVLLYICVEGANPMRRDSLWETLVAIREDPLPAVHRAGPLGPLIWTLLNKDPAARPNSEELARALAAVADGHPYRPGDDAADAAAAGTISPSGAVSVVAPSDLPPTVSAVTTGAAPGTLRKRAPGIVRVGVLTTVGILVLASSIAIYNAQQGALGAAHDAAASVTTPGAAAPDATAPASTASAMASTATLRAAPPATTPPSSGAWIAQLSASPQSTPQDRRDQELLTIQKDIPGAKILNSDDWSSLQPGNWVIYATGTFPDGNAVLAFCSRHGQSKCFGRYLSHAAADSRYICLPGPDGPPRDPENCHRP